MQLIFTHKFIKDYRLLPQDLQEMTDKKLALLLINQNHPSLHIKKMQDPRNIWEGRIAAGYRFTFLIEADCYVLRRVGTHDILRKP
jgi:mRNA-degrading endonuclease RelE of RelBE toxin-antitoxin system